MCITFRPIKNETVVVLDGAKVVGTIKRYRAHKACIVHIPGVMDTSAPRGSRLFPNIPAAKAAVLSAYSCGAVALDPDNEGCDQCGKHPVRDVLDGDKLCQSCCDKWARNQEPDPQDIADLERSMRGAGVYRGALIESRLADLYASMARGM